MKIPKTIHQVWLGPNPMPDEFKRYSQQWKDCHPGWGWKLWSSENLPLLTNQDSFNKSLSWAGKCDIVRLELIYQFGGIYVDQDFECFKSIEPLINNDFAFIGMQTERDSSVKVINSILGAVPNYPPLKKILNEIPDSVENMAVRGAGDQTGPEFLVKFVSPTEWHMVEPGFLHPYSFFEKHREKESFPEAYGAHRWAESWLKDAKLFNFIVPAHNQLNEIKNTIESVISQPDSLYVLIDWGSTDGTLEWVKGNFSQARIYQVKTTEPMNLSYACNIGCGANWGCWQCFMHPGVRLDPSFVSTLAGSARKDTIYTNIRAGQPTWMVMVNKSAMWNFAGFDSVMQGAGFGNRDLLTRCKLTGMSEAALLGKLAENVNPDSVPKEDPAMIDINATYSAVKRDLISMNSMPVLDIAFRRQLYKTVCQAYKDGKRDFEIGIKPLLIGAGKERGTVHRTLRYSVMHG